MLGEDEKWGLARAASRCPYLTRTVSWHFCCGNLAVGTHYPSLCMFRLQKRPLSLWWHLAPTQWRSRWQTLWAYHVTTFVDSLMLPGNLVREVRLSLCCRQQNSGLERWGISFKTDYSSTVWSLSSLHSPLNHCNHCPLFLPSTFW